MAKKNQERERLVIDAEDGDALADRAAADRAMEDGDGMPEFVALERGVWVCVWTVTYIYVGRVMADTYEYLVIHEPAQVFETGEVGNFYRTGVAKSCEQTFVTNRIRRGAIITVADWPTGRPPTQG